MFKHFLSPQKKTFYAYEICITTVKFGNTLVSILTDLNNFHSLEAVDRVSEAQLQVSENSN